uniref:hypothetical protein n=1 Tax=Picosynechococcus sp. (strain ATCC 27264 / PCC 7002 / PR-6) TaxID=32049 RepID=UPI001C3CB3E0
TTTLENSVQAIASTVQSQGKAIQSLEVQLSQMTTSLHTMQKGKFPSCSDKNPKEECNAITLRSGKELNKYIMTDGDEPPQEEDEAIIEDVVGFLALNLKLINFN